MYPESPLRATESLDGNDSQKLSSDQIQPAYKDTSSLQERSDLDVHTPDSGSTASSAPAFKPKKNFFQYISFSKRRVMAVSAVITLFVIALTGVTGIFLAKNQRSDDKSNNQIPAQEIDLTDGTDSLKAPEITTDQEALLVSGDIITKSSLKVSQDGYLALLQAGSLSSNREYTLPDSSGTICLDNNNCNRASLQQINQLQSQLSNLQNQLGQIVVPDVPASTLVNNQRGAVSIQGTTNQVNVSTKNGVIKISTPQSLAQINAPTFAGMFLTGNFTVGGNVTLSAFDCSANANGGVLTTNASGQIVCSDDDNSGGGGNAPDSAQYLTLAADGALSAERVLIFNGTNLSVSDGGPNGNYTVNTAQNIHTGASPLFQGITIGSGGLTVNSAGGANISGTTSINTTGTSSTSIGNLTGDFSLNSSAFRVSTAGALSGITTIVTSGTINSATITGGSLSASAVNGLNISSTAISTFTADSSLSINANGVGTISIGGTSSGNIFLGGGVGNTGCTVDNATGNFSCDGNINGATITAGSLNGATITGGNLAGGNFTGGDVSGGVLTDNKVNSLNVNLDGNSGTAISSDTSSLSINAQGNNTIDIGGISTGDINFAGGFGGTGCSITTNGNFNCDGTINGNSIDSDSITFGASGPASIVAGGTGQAINIDGSTTGAVRIGSVSTGSIELGGSGVGDILFGGGIGGTGCTISNATGDIDCDGAFNGITLDSSGADPTIGVSGKTLTIQSNVSLDQSLLTTSNPTFAGLTVDSIASSSGNDLTLGSIGGNQSTLIQGDGITLTNVAGANTIHYQFDNTSPGKTSGSTYNICDTSGNCVGLGGGITGSGSPTSIPIFTSSNTLGNSLLSQNDYDGDATEVRVAGNLVVNGGLITRNGTLNVSTTGANALTLTSGSSSIVLGGGTNTIQRTNSQLNIDIIRNTNPSTLNLNNSGTGGVANLNVSGGVNIGSGQSYAINGTSINTAGTLSNVAYLTQNNNFNGNNISGVGTFNGQTISSTSVFTGTVEIQGASALTLGTAGPAGDTGSILFRNSSGNNTVTLKASDVNPVASFTITLPSALPVGTECLSLNSSGQIGTQSCSSGLGGSGTTGAIAFFDSPTSLADSLLTQSGSVVSILGPGNSFNVEGTISVGSNGGSGNRGTIEFLDGSNPGRVVSVRAQNTEGSSYTLELPSTNDVGSTCLILESVAAGVNRITGGNCAAGGSGGNVTASGGSTSNRLVRFTNNGSSYTAVASMIQDDGSGIGINTAPNGGYILRVGSANAFNVTDSGQLEIGTGGSPLTLAPNGNISNVGTLGASGQVTLSRSAANALRLTGVAPTGNDSLLQLGPNAIASGSANGTYIGINPTSFNGNFLDFQVNGVNRLRVDSSGNITAGSLNGVTISGNNSLSVTGASSINQDLTNTSNTVQFGTLSLANALMPAYGGTGADNSGANAGYMLLFDSTANSGAGAFVSALPTSSDGSIIVTPSDGGLDLQVNGCDNCAQRSLDNLQNVAINTSLLPGQSGVSVGGSNNPFQYLYLYGGGSYGGNNFRLGGTATAPRQLALPDASGTLCYVDGGGSGNCTGVNGGSGNTNYIFNQTSQQSDANFNILARTGTVAAVIRGASGQNIANFVSNAGSTVASINQSGGLTAATINGATISSTSFNSLTLSGTAITGTGALAINGSGANDISIGGTSTGNILLGGGYSGSSGCTVINSNGNLECNGSLTTGTTGSATGSIVFKGSTPGSGQITLAGPNNPSLSNYTLSIPTLTSNDTICVVALGNCTGQNGGSGNTNYIWNAADDSAGNRQTTANINIEGKNSTVAAVFRGASGQDIAHFDNNAGTTVARFDQNGALTSVGVNSGTGLIQGTGGLAVTGANSSINTSSNFSTSINTGTSTGAVSIGNSLAGAINIQSSNIVSLTSGTSSNLSLTAGGSSNTGVVVKTSSNSTNAFVVQNASSVALLTADTSNMRVTIGNASGSLNGRDLVVADLDVTTSLRIGDGTNGISFNDETANKLRFRGNARNTKTISLVPEFAGLTLKPDGGNNIGTLTSGIDTTPGAFHNYYNWTTTQGSAQDYDLYVRVPVPRDWGAFPSGGQICYNVWATGGFPINSDITTTFYDTSDTAQSSFNATPSSPSTWEQKCTTNIGGTVTVNGNSYFTIRIHVTADPNQHVRIGEITFDYLSVF